MNIQISVPKTDPDLKKEKNLMIFLLKHFMKINGVLMKMFLNHLSEDTMSMVMMVYGKECLKCLIKS